MNTVDLKNFECPVCMEYFQKPIFQCITGHSICSNCKSKVDRCPFCNSTFLSTRNLTLEGLLTTLKAKCKHDDCTKMIPLHTYARHVKDECPFQNIKCKIKTCTWKGNSALVADHIKAMHRTFLVNKFDKLQSHQLTLSFIEHNNDMFVIRRHAEGNQFIWSAEPVNKIPTEELLLMVKISTPCGKRNFLKQPVASYIADNSDKAKELSMIYIAKSKLKGCEFQLSIY